MDFKKLKELTNEIKRSHPIVDTARGLGLELHKAGLEYRSHSIYDRGNNDNCTAFYPDSNSFFDFKAQKGGDVITLVAEIKHGGNIGNAINDLSGGKLINCGAEYEKYIHKLDADINKWHSALRPEDIKYLKERGLTDDYINKMRLGYDEKEQRLIIPYIECGQVVYYIGRDRSGKEGTAKYKKTFLDGFNKNVIWGLHTLDRTDQPLVIAEGAFDAISFDIAGYRVLSGMSGLSNDNIKTVCGYAEIERNNKQNVYICFDNDAAGKNFFKRLAQELIKHKFFNFKRLELPQQYKDISEYFAAGGDLQALIDTPINGTTAFLNFFAPVPDETKSQEEKREGEFKNFILNYGRYADKHDLISILLQARIYFNPEWVDALYEKVKRAPLEDDIIAEVLDEHELIYKPKAGFYEYDHIWRRVDDKLIGSYIGAKLGRIYATGSRISSIMLNFKTKVLSDAEFDKKPLFVFKNGTLEFETGNFRACDKSDMSTILLPYSYDPKATCPKFKEFLRQIFWSAERKLQDVDGDARIDLMQEFAGYVLYTDCSFQKALLLLGEGSNGKSTLLDLIKYAFGESNFYSVDIDKLNKDFQAVQLIGKLGSITTEAGLNFGGAEDTFKKLVAGEEVTGCYKFKDNFSFKTRAKFFIAANRLPGVKDTSYGFYRRFTILNFQNNFDGDRADRQLKEKLKAEEIAGIFNWAYEGYQRLKKNGQFTQSPDDKELLTEFIESNNSVYAFAVDEQFNKYCGIFTVSEIYEKYTAWCSKNGQRPKSKVHFSRELRQVLRQLNIEFSAETHHDGRYINFTKPDYLE